MQVIEVQFTPWEQSYFFQPKDQSGNQLVLKKGDEVIVETALGIDLAKVMEKGELAELPENIEEVKPIIRQATTDDQLKVLELNKNKSEFFKACLQLIKKYQLQMKLVDVHTSFDENRLTYAFIADSRVDFRNLVKDLIKRTHKSVRLQQIGVRDEAKVNGDVGPCGRLLCCQTFLKELGNVSTDFAKYQQVAHRGSERLSGVCNRLKCCLRYEQPVYEELAKGFPEIGSRLKTKYGDGEVVSWYPLKGKVGVNIGTEEKPEMVEVEVK